MPICPSCDGNKTIMTHLNFGGRKPSEWRELACETCQAQGEVDQEVIEQRTAGHRLRDLRVKHTKMSLRDMAAHLGTMADIQADVVQVSRWERGKDPIPRNVTVHYERCAGVGEGWYKNGREEEDANGADDEATLCDV